MDPQSHATFTCVFLVHCIFPDVSVRGGELPDGILPDVSHGENLLLERWRVFRYDKHDAGYAGVQVQRLGVAAQQELRVWFHSHQFVQLGAHGGAVRSDQEYPDDAV